MNHKATVQKTIPLLLFLVISLSACNNELPPQADALNALLSYVPDTPAHRQYLAFANYEAWLQSSNLTPISKLDDLSKPELSNLYLSPHIFPPAALLQGDIESESMFRDYGFDLFGSNTYLTTGQDQNQMTIMTHSNDMERI